MESDIRDNPAMSRSETPPLRQRALAVAYYKVLDGRVDLLHTEVPRELSRLRYGSRLAQAFSKRCDAREKSNRDVPSMSSYAARHPSCAALLDG